ncbi:MAG: homoprotocatechuate degradation operon regulator HpaR [Alcaligenaceae bacterium]|nr:homoprotocatechuate degradation operon regulator HpaR [Alcaligenaceae bacterium]
MSPDITKRNLPQLLLKARESLLCHFRPILSHFGLTEQQWRIVRELATQGMAEPNQLCDACVILSPSMVGVLARLQTMGLVARSNSPHDKRRILIRLTPEGEALYHRIAPLVEEQYHLLEHTVGTELIQEAYELVDRLLSAPTDQTPSVTLPEKIADPVGK